MNREELIQEIHKKQQALDYLKEERERVSDYIGLFEIAQAIDNVNESKDVPIIVDRQGFIRLED